MLNWKAPDKRFLTEHKWVILFWVTFILFTLAYIITTPYGALNVLVSQNYNSKIGQFFRYYTSFGEEWLLVPIGLFLLFLNRNRDFAIRLIITFLTNTLVTITFKFWIFSTNRPKLVLEKFHLVFTEGVKVNQYNSFPSGHTSAAFAMALAIAFWYNDSKLSIFMVFLAIFVGLSRIYLQQHFVEDVMGGAVIGLVAAMFASGFSFSKKS
jgi:membrane-associated phospholipid phosphatase